MLKTIVSILLILAFTAQTFKGGMVVMNYYANTEAFAKNCVNKAKPKLHCNGKCQMMKKMQEEERKDQQVPERKAENKLEVISSHSLSFNVDIAYTFIASLAITIDKHYPITDISYAFFHPPRA